MEGPDKGATFPLGKERHTFGRADADILLHDPEVSKLHAAIACLGDGYALTDLQSTNGTYLNGKRVVEAPLAHLDQIQMGSTKLLFTILKATTWAEAAPQDTQGPAKRRILLVDTSPLREGIAGALAKANLEVVSARDAKEATVLFRRLRPLLDLLVLSLDIEKMEDCDFVAWLRQQRLEGGPCVLALTQACTLREVLRSLEGLEVTALLPKTTAPADIASCAADLLKAGDNQLRLPLPARPPLDVVYHIGRETFRGIIADLGQTGIGIQACQPCRQGTEVDLVFILPEVPRLFRASGRVRGVQYLRGGAHADIEFLNLDPQAKSQIAAFLMAMRLKLAGSRQGDPAKASAG